MDFTVKMEVVAEKGRKPLELLRPANMTRSPM